MFCMIALLAVRVIEAAIAQTPIHPTQYKEVDRR